MNSPQYSSIHLRNTLALSIHIHMYQGVTKGCRLSWLTNSVLVIRVLMRGDGGSCGSEPMSRAVHITWHWARINFGDLPPYLTYDTYILTALSFRQENQHLHNQSVCPFVRICSPPPTPSPPSECVLPRRNQRGEATLACGWGGGRGEPIRTGEKAWHSVYSVRVKYYILTLFGTCSINWFAAKYLIQWMPATWF
jgi:hypothetical protein